MKPKPAESNPSIPFWQPKGADRKQKTDREKIEKRTTQEREKYQPSYDTTILTEVRSREPKGYVKHFAKTFILSHLMSYI